MKKNKRPFMLFYLLVFYVLIQFSWWAYLLLSLNSEVYVHKKEAIFLSAVDAVDRLNKETALNLKLNDRLLMIAGEGAVFMIILLVGISRVKKSFQKEIEINRQQKNFLLSVTHELKSPIASARLQLETFLKRDLDKGTQQKIITNALNDTIRLNELVEKVLLATRIESAVNFDVSDKINVSDSLKELVQQTIKNASVKQTIEEKIESGLHLLISQDDWGFIVNNLVENAIKYSPQDSTIKVGLTYADDSIVLIVADQGETIPEKEKEKIVEKFYRIGNEDTRKTKGTGLGLYIVKSLVEKYNGVLTIRNNVPTGNCFEIKFMID